uniref:Uncharacterized protein n=1 Tax=Anguilla anguilla TaxID=7936 RepID=A0A0E9QTJ2_ANGAN
MVNSDLPNSLLTSAPGIRGSSAFLEFFVFMNCVTRQWNLVLKLPSLVPPPS